MNPQAPQNGQYAQQGRGVNPAGQAGQHTQKGPNGQAQTHPNSTQNTLQIAEIREAFKLPPMLTTKTEVLTKQLIEEARKDPSALAQIIRSWLNESK